MKSLPPLCGVTDNVGLKLHRGFRTERERGGGGGRERERERERERGVVSTCKPLCPSYI